MGIAPTGKHVTVTGVVISRFAGGKSVEDWELIDSLGMLQQLGAIPAPELAGAGAR
jgi:predicted ester cyclase